MNRFELFQRADTYLWLLANQIRAFCQALAQISASPSRADCLSVLPWVGENPLCTMAVITVLLLGEGRLLPVPLVTQFQILVFVSPGLFIFQRQDDTLKKEFFLPDSACEATNSCFQDLFPLPLI